MHDQQKQSVDSQIAVDQLETQRKAVNKYITFIVN